MNALTPSFSFDHHNNQAFPWLKKQLSRAGLRLMQTFDLRLTAALKLGYCPCPHHGTHQCDCQMIVLLVYGKSSEPVTLILHGNNGQSWLSLVKNPQQGVDPGIQLAIEQALQRNYPNRIIIKT